MYPFNTFEKLNQAPSGRRDNSLIIRDNYVNETAQYSQRKKTLESFQEQTKMKMR